MLKTPKLRFCTSSLTHSQRETSQLQILTSSKYLTMATATEYKYTLTTESDTEMGQYWQTTESDMETGQ